MAVRTKTVDPARNGAASASAPAIEKSMRLVIPELSVQVLEVDINGIAPLVIRAWDQKTKQQMADKAQGRQKVKSRDPVDPEAVFNGARYISEEGWDGIPASAFKGALVEAVSCYDLPKTEFSMTLAKKTFFVLADGTCRLSGRDLVRIEGAKPEVYKLMQPTSGGGPYMSYRPIYRQWRCRLRIQYNSARIDAQGVLNLLATAGYWVGVGEHRPASKESRTGAMGRWSIVPSDGK